MTAISTNVEKVAVLLLSRPAMRRRFELIARTNQQLRHAAALERRRESVEYKRASRVPGGPQINTVALLRGMGGA